MPGQQGIQVGQSLGQQHDLPVQDDVSRQPGQDLQLGVTLLVGGEVPPPQAPPLPVATGQGADAIPLDLEDVVVRVEWLGSDRQHRQERFHQADLRGVFFRR